MKKLIILLFLVFGLYSCQEETPCTVTDDINQLKGVKSELQKDVWKLGDEKSHRVHEIDSLIGVLKIVDIYKSGTTPQYILKIRLKQSHLSLDLEKHMKNAMNSIEFELPVDKGFYDSVEEGTEIVDRFRVGSFMLNGDLGSWKMTVRSKEIR